MSHNTDTELSDISLFQSLVAGNKRSLGELYQRYFEPMLNYGLKYSYDEDLVKDSIHDVFVNCFGNIKIRIFKIISVRSYLFKALRNSIFDKKARNGRAPFIDEMSFVMPMDEDLFEKIFPKDDQQSQIATTIIHTIAQLSPNAKTALYLRFVKDFSHKEIAEVLNISEQGSMNLISKTIKALRQKFASKI